MGRRSPPQSSESRTYLSVLTTERLENALISKTVELRSRIKAELAHDKDGKLTNWETGRRFVFITVPKSPLEKDLQVGIFSAEIYHREMKARREKCDRCLLPNHVAAQCTNEIVCLGCFKPKTECSQPLTSAGADPTSHPPSQEDWEAVAADAAASGATLHPRRPPSPPPNVPASSQISFPPPKKPRAQR